MAWVRLHNRSSWRQALDMFADIKKDKEKFKRFTSNFGRYIKVGVIEDQDNKDALLKYASFASTASDDREVRTRSTSASELCSCTQVTCGKQASHRKCVS